MALFKRWARLLAPLLFWLAVWQLAALGVASPLLLPGPLLVWERFCALSVTADFWLSAAASLARIGSGYLLALGVGAGFAVATTQNRLADLLLSPLLRIVKTVPVASFIVLALLWLGKSLVPLVIAFLMVLPLVWANVSRGIQQTDPGLLEMARCFGLGPGARLRRVQLPAARPYFFSAAQTGLGFAWKSGVAAEVLATPVHGVGSRLYQAKIYLETPDLFAWTLLLILLSLLIEQVFSRWCRRWQGGGAQ